MARMSKLIRGALLLVLFGSATAQAASGLPSSGTIRIDFSQGGNDEVSFVGSDGTSESDRFQEASGRDAGKLVFPSGSNILDFVGGSKCSVVGFESNKDWIGCYEKRGIDTGRIGRQQSLIVSLDPAGHAGGATVTSWRWAFTAKHDASFDMVLSTDGAETETLHVFTGKSAIGIEAGGNIFTCSPGSDSGPDSDTACIIEGTQAWQSVEIRVTNDGKLAIGDGDSEFNVTEMTGTLTCEEDLQSGGEATTLTEPLTFSIDGVDMQCRRLPNRGTGTPACAAVPYVVAADCEDGGDGECAITFSHGDQPGVDREDFAFLCEVWWPPRAGGLGVNTNGQLTGNILPKTIIEWENGDGPTVPGDVPVDYCAGVTPLFDAPSEPNMATSCGASVSYLLSAPLPGILNGGTVMPDSAECSLLEAYDDVLLPAGFPDQCDSNGACPDGQQVACLIDSRISQVEDPAADCQGTGSSSNGDCDTLGPIAPGELNPSNPSAADSLFRNYELIFIKGDLRMRRL